MSGFDNELTGILSMHDRKEKDTHPDFKGNATINGVDYWIDAWTQERKNGSGRKFFKLKFKAKDQPQAGNGRSRDTGRDDMSSDVPF